MCLRKDGIEHALDLALRRHESGRLTE